MQPVQHIPQIPPVARARQRTGQYGTGQLRAAFAPRVVLRYRDRVRNAVCGIAAAACIGMADVLMLPVVIVSAFVAQVGGGNNLVALIPVVSALAWGIPGAIAGSIIANQPRVVPLVAGATGIWAVLVGMLVLLGATQIDGTARGLLSVFFALNTFAMVAGSVTLLATDRLPGRVTTPYERTTTVRGRAYGSAGAMVLAALIARSILAGDTAGSYLGLFAVASVFLFGAAGLTLALVERTPRMAVVPRPPLLGLRAAPDLLRLPAYRRYLTFRAFALFATVAEPFYIVYAVRELRMTGAYVGSALLVLVLARVVALVVSRILIRATGTHLLLQLATLFRTLAATAAIALPAVWDTNLFGSRFLADDARGGSFLIVFACLGAALGMSAAGQGGFLLDILPPDAYPGGVAFTNGTLAVLSLALIAGGVIANRQDIPTLFAVAVALGVLSMLVGGLLREPRLPRGFAPRKREG